MRSAKFLGRLSRSFPFVLAAGLICLLAAGPAVDPATAAQLTLAWDANTEPDLAGYKLHYGYASRNYSVNLDLGKQTVYTVSALEAGRTYYFAVTAYDALGSESGYSDEVSYSVPPEETVSAPSAPSGPVSGNNGTGYNYALGGSTSSTGDPVQYQVEWGDQTNSGWLAVGTVSASKSWSAAGTYTVRAKARCAAHNAVESGWGAGLAVTVAAPAETVGAPSAPSGPAGGHPGNSYVYALGGSVSSYGDPVQYQVEWGDQTNSGWLAVGTVSASKSWSAAGTYTVRAKARCATHNAVESGWGAALAVNIVVLPETVSAPSAAAGPASGSTGKSYIYALGGSTSSAGDPVQYQVEWGDGTNSGWLAAGTVSASKAWRAAGTYTIRVNARCAAHISVESGWGATLTVSVTKDTTAPAPPKGFKWNR